MPKSVATIIVVTNLKPNVPSKPAFMWSGFERCIVILTDNIFFLSENLFVLEEWQCIWMAMEQSAKKPVHSQISDLNVKLELGDGVKEAHIFGDNKPFQQLKLVQVLWARQCLKIKGIGDTSMSWWLISLLQGFLGAKFSWFNMFFCIKSQKPLWATFEKTVQPVNLQNNLLIIFETMQTY